ncbi:UDP-glucose dehydrogenase family protein [Paenibacillus qinlingensis]|uniref:UDP-glucose dehydrogenase family protein n=1 Tax=Paenibacillus qinlingensis TaxID=1837343 RepID=UPI001566607A|nr:UDP-glucose/GDP-mannose dehydrogenase family protein [Paenibacillus qinlingensis]NQX58360.1 UDP-glucose/GDP-mannose dehydrogenase family protein [Paenibacillus qinlingensis]
MQLTIIGTGYVGLVAAVCFAKLGHFVTAVDREHVIHGLRENKLSLWEPDLQEMLESCRREGRLFFDTDITHASRGADALMIAVGTPSGTNGHTDLSQVDEVIAQLKQGDGVCPPLIIVKSTVPVGTCDELEANLLTAGLHTEVVFNPEFLRQGSAINDFMNPDRIVFGCRSHLAKAALHQMYKGINAPIQVCDRRSAELIKYASNAFLAMKISFANMIADVCEGYGADNRQVMQGVGADRRIGPHFLQAGIGYGGSCFSKDLQSLLTSGNAIGRSLPLLEATAQINEERIPQLLEKLISLWGNPRGKRLGVLGISFKPNTNDMRDAPFLTLLRLCYLYGIEVQTFDPVVQTTSIEGVIQMDTAYEVATDADALIIMTEWPQFAELDWVLMAQLMYQPILLDGRNVLSEETISRLLLVENVIYIPVGRPLERTNLATSSHL